MHAACNETTFSSDLAPEPHPNSALAHVSSARTMASADDAATPDAHETGRAAEHHSRLSLTTGELQRTPHELKMIRRLFPLVASVNVIINLDGGAVPAALTNIKNTFDLTSLELGLLGALVYLGIASGSLVMGPLLKRVSPVMVLRVAILCNTGMTATFGLALNPGMLLVARYLIGFLQAACPVYFPVWVDEFAPKKTRTLWMALIQAGTPIGIMIGYVIAGAMTQDTDDETGWRVPFLAQARRSRLARRTHSARLIPPASRHLFPSRACSRAC